MSVYFIGYLIDQIEITQAHAMAYMCLSYRQLPPVVLTNFIEQLDWCSLGYAANSHLCIPITRSDEPSLLNPSAISNKIRDVTTLSAKLMPPKADRKCQGQNGGYRSRRGRVKSFSEVVQKYNGKIYICAVVISHFENLLLWKQRRWKKNSMSS